MREFIQSKLVEDVSGEVRVISHLVPVTPSQVAKGAAIRSEAKPVRKRQDITGLAPGEESFAEPHVHKFKAATAGAFIGECACGERGRV